MAESDYYPSDREVLEVGVFDTPRWQPFTHYSALATQQVPTAYQQLCALE